VWLQNQLVLQGRRAPPALWIFQLPSTKPTIPQPNTDATSEVNATIGTPNAAYAHATLFSPLLETLQEALRRGYVRNFPGMTAKTLHCHPSPYQLHPPESTTLTRRDNFPSGCLSLWLQCHSCWTTSQSQGCKPSGGAQTDSAMSLTSWCTMQLYHAW
jgi:hypothetical protein